MDSIFGTGQGIPLQSPTPAINSSNAAHSANMSSQIKSELYENEDSYADPSVGQIEPMISSDPAGKDHSELLGDD